jgi:integrase
VKDVKTSFHTACRRAEIKGLRFHDLRHTFATWYYRATHDVVALQKILGHSKIEMTMRYVHETFEDMQAGVESLEALYANKLQVGTKPVNQVKKSEVEIPASHRYINN